MRLLYHLVLPAVWEQAPAGAYVDPSLHTEGFIHCSTPAQVEPVANRFFATVPALLALEIDADLLTVAVLEERAAVPKDDPFAGQLFPHVYGPLDRAAIRAVVPLRRDEAGAWCLPM